MGMKMEKGMRMAENRKTRCTKGNVKVKLSLCQGHTVPSSDTNC